MTLNQFFAEFVRRDKPTLTGGDLIFLGKNLINCELARFVAVCGLHAVTSNGRAMPSELEEAVVNDHNRKRFRSLGKQAKRGRSCGLYMGFLYSALCARAQHFELLWREATGEEMPAEVKQAIAPLDELPPVAQGDTVRRAFLP